MNSSSSHDNILAAIRNYRSRETPQQQEQRKKQQYASQLKLLAQMPCPRNQLRDIQRNLSSLDAPKLKEISQKEFYNGDAMKAILCSMESVSYISDSSLDVNFRLRDYFRKMRQIGPPSVQGVAMKSDLEQTQNMFVMKVPRDPKDSDLYHETFVGLYGTNTLRTLIPNFAYVFGSFRCSGPVIHGGGSETKGKIKKDVITWCNNLRENSPYILYENIAPNISMHELASRGSLSDFLNAYLQVLYALNVAYQEIEFTHYDLHTDNVLIREIPGLDNMEIPYSTENGLEYLRTSRIATLIDFGFAHFRYEGKGYGMIGLEKFGIEQNAPLLFHDAYKLLMFSLEARKKTGKQDYKRFQRLVQLVNPGTDIDTVLKEQREVYFSLPRLGIYSQINILEWARQVRIQFPQETNFFSREPQGGVVTSCEFSVCHNQQQTLEMVGLLGSPNPKDVIEYYDLMSKKLKPETIERVKTIFPYQEALTNGMTDYKTIADSIKDLFRNFKRVRIEGSDTAIVFSGPFLNRFRDYTQKLAEAFDLYADLEVYRKALIFTAQSYGDKQLISSINKIYQDLIPQLRTLQISAQALNQDIRYIETLQKSDHNRIKQLTRRNPELNWYEEYLPMYKQMLATSIKY